MCLLWLGYANKIIQNHPRKPGTLPSRILVPGLRGAQITESKWKLQGQAELGTNLGAAVRHTAGSRKAITTARTHPCNHLCPANGREKFGIGSHPQGFRGAKQRPEWN